LCMRVFFTKAEDDGHYGLSRFILPDGIIVAKSRATILNLKVKL
jgi:hypothetical protein